MKKKSMYSFFLIVSLLGLLSLLTKIQNVRAPPLIITIEADGSISPTLANITTSDNVTYTFTADMDASITVQRSNIVIDGEGCTLNGANFVLMDGFILTSVSNVTIVNVNIREFIYHSISLTYASQCVISGNVAAEGVGGITVGIGLHYSTGNTVSDNVITGFTQAVELISSSGNNISGNNISGIGPSATPIGIYLHHSTANMILGNNITDNNQGILLSISSLNTIAGNNMTSNSWGIVLEASSDNTLSGNNVTDSDTGIRAGSALVDSVLVQSTNNTILGNNVVNNFNGVDVIGVLFTTISRNRIAGNSQYGIALDAASNNTISENQITNNNLGVFYDGLCNNNTAYHNNFIDNIIQFEISPGDVGDWDDGVEGNYWSDYGGVDLNHDGIVDSPFMIDASNTDYYPLMGPFRSFNTSLGKSINIISNSTVDGFRYESPSTIRFRVSNTTASQTHGFCRVSIPYEVLPEPFNVTIDGANPTYWNYTLYENGTHRWIYFEYEHSTKEVVILLEFPSLAIIPLFMISTLSVALAYRRKQTLKP